MRSCHTASAGFDDPNLVSCAGLVPPPRREVSGPSLPLSLSPSLPPTWCWLRSRIRTSAHKEPSGMGEVPGYGRQSLTH